MARIWTNGAELNSATSGVEVTTVGANMSVSSSTVRSGTYSWRSNPAASNGACGVTLYTSDQSTIGYLRFYLYIATAPDANAFIVRLLSTSNGLLGRILLTSGRVIRVQDASNANLTGSKTLSLNTWYCVELKIDATTNPGALEMKIDGVVINSGANTVQGSFAKFQFGVAVGTVTTDLFFDDLAFNDNSGSDQNTYPGPGKVICLRPNATGDSAQWTIGGSAPAATNWQSVNELPPDDAVTLVNDVVLSKVDMYNMTNASLLPGDEVKVVQVGVRFNNDIADATSAFQVQVEKAANGTKSQSAAITPNSTTWRTNVAAGSSDAFPLTLYRDPDANQWNNLTIDSMQAGYIASLIGVNKVQVSALWVYVDYVPAEGQDGRFFIFF